jgi:leucyl-tRNA synthetase
MSKYQLEEIEKKWRNVYEEKKSYEADLDEKKEKFFITVPVMYPDGRLHTGHMYTWTRADVFARFQRMKGKNVLFPQGFHMTGGPMAGMSLRLKNGDEKAIKIMRDQGATDEDIKRFAGNPLELGLFFGKTYKSDFNLVGTSIDWRRNFILSYTEQYSKFVEWQFRTLKDIGYITQGNHPVVWCPNENTSLGDHDRAEGEGESPMEFTIIKFKVDNFVLPAATLRPETIYGVSNLWINEKGEYKKIRFSNGEEWIVSKEFTEKLPFQKNIAEKIENFNPAEIVGKTAKNPVNNEEIPILNGEFVKTDRNTGIVMGVPMHAPFDYSYYNKKKAEIKLKEAKKIIDVKTNPNLMEEAIKRFGTADENSLEDATKYVYKTEFNYGVLNENNGPLSGKPVKEAKEYAIELIKKNNAYDNFYETSGEVICRCGAKGLIKLVQNQWFIRYSDKQLKEKTIDWIQKMDVRPEEAKAQIINAVYNMEDKAATRSGGLGTPLPWDKNWLIEPLSDSTIYMAYYTFAHIIKDMKPEEITDEMFDYILLDKNSGKKFTETVEKMKREFDYWYPLDLRVTAKELITNHIAFFIMTHVAIFNKDKWPRGLGINGWLTVNGKKMSKSKGNTMTIDYVVNNYGADSARLIASASNGMDDAAWDLNNINGFKQKIEFILELTEIMNSFSGERKLVDEFLLSKVNYLIENSEKSYNLMKYKNSLNYSFFEFIENIKNYIDYGGNNKDTLKYAITVFSKLTHPIFPFVTEEINNALNKGELLESYQSWPEIKEEYKNEIVENEFEVLNQTLEDINNLLNIINKDPKEIIIGMAGKEKFEVYNKVEEITHRSRDIKEIRKEVPINDFVNKLLKNPKRLPNKRLDYELEKKVFIESKEKLKERYNAEIKIEESNEEKAFPGKPMIVIK